MKKTLLFILSYLFIYQTLYSQKNRNLETKYTNYFQNTREIPYLHLNKTTFLKGEEIWFQAYVIEQNSEKPHPTTSNLYVTVFDELGKQKQQHLIHVKNGIGRGNILIDSSFTKDNYFIKASTNWMKNFKEDNSYTQKITILSDQKKVEVVTSSEDDFFDFQIFPEGGHLVSDVENKIGILIKDRNNKGQKTVKGHLRDINSKEIVKEFATNIFGLGSLIFNFKNDKKYQLEALLENGSKIIKEITIPKKEGIVMNIENPNTVYLKIKLATNNKTLNVIKGKVFKVWIHNTKSYYAKTISFQKNENIKTLYIKNKILPKGINIVTIFDENNHPILERLLFNYDANWFAKPNLAFTKIINDSLSTTITNSSNEKLFLSASFLPKKTKAYNPKNNIYTTFLLKPYIKGNIEKSDYYFKNVTRKTLNNLDLLLITQGWSKYKWNNIFTSPSIPNYKFENGIDITFKLNKLIKKEQSVLVYSKENNLVTELVGDENPFIIENLFIKKNSKISFSLKQNNKLLEITPILSYSNSETSEFLNENYFLNKNFSKEIKELSISNLPSITKGREVLDEVVIVSNKKFDNKTRAISRAYKKINYNELPFSKGSLIQFIIPIELQYRNTRQPLRKIYLNGEKVSGNNSLSGISMDQVREVRMGTSIVGLTREMHIYTYSLKELNKLNIKTTEIKLPVGFANEKEYYEPKYFSFVDENFQKYGALHWEPNLLIEPNSSIKINIPSHFQKAISVFVEGISSSGKLISQKKSN